MIVGRCLRFTPSNDINARMPPSPSLSMRIATDTYLIVVMTIKVRITSDNTPSVVAASGVRPASPQHRLERVERARPDVAEDHSQCREAECGQASGAARYCINSYVRQRANSGNREDSSFSWQQKHVGNLLASRERLRARFSQKPGGFSQSSDRDDYSRGIAEAHGHPQTRGMVAIERQAVKRAILREHQSWLPVLQGWLATFPADGDLVAKVWLG